MSVAFMAFENETDALSVGGMSIENRLDRISIYGSLDITKDKSGLTDALVLKRVIDAAIDEMKRDKNLPEAIQTLKPEEVSNPF
ncbi:MAG: hypothetical protein PHO27_12715 [Sulfuricurvum sp.]|nr:hypothetical protein [Sulfuricurvum sp.]